MTTLIRALNSIGKSCFVKYYEYFKKDTDISSLAKILLNENPNAISLQAQKTRINYARWIFENNLEKEALETIVKARVDYDVKQKAEILFRGIISKNNN